MKKTNIFKRIISLFIAMTLLFAVCMPAFAENSSSDLISHEVGYEALTKEAYIQMVMERTQKSRDEVVRELEETKKEMLEKYGVKGATPPITPFAFDDTKSEYIGDGVTMHYGYVYFIDTYANCFKIRSECPATYAQHHYGAAFSSVETSGGRLHAASSGQWTIESESVQVYQDSSTTVRIQYSAVIDVVKNEAISIGADLGFFNVTGSEGGDIHLRKHVSNSNSYSLPNPA